MVRTGLPGRVEHVIAYAGAAAVAMSGYGASSSIMRIIGGFWVYAGNLEYLQHLFSRPASIDQGFRCVALGALCGALAVALVWRRLSV